jgi:hypothetical protein
MILKCRANHGLAESMRDRLYSISGEDQEP